jgi:sec-independent protein translocase protein TatC
MQNRDSCQLDVVGHLEELRRRIFIYLAVLLVTSGFFFAKGEMLLSFAKAPLEGLVAELIFISPTEVFVSYLKVVLLFAFVLTFPILLFEIWSFLVPAMDRDLKRRSVLWLFLALGCFLGGLFFSYRVALPAALKFLLSFGANIAKAQLTLSQYVSFFTTLMAIGGIIFELPVVLGVLTDLGIVQTSLLRAKRKYAIFFILVFSAVITPTQDIFNMLVFALPMIILYEVGIAISFVIEKQRRNTAKDAPGV